MDLPTSIYRSMIKAAFEAYEKYKRLGFEVEPKHTELVRKVVMKYVREIMFNGEAPTGRPSDRGQNPEQNASNRLKGVELMKTNKAFKVNEIGSGITDLERKADAIGTAMDIIRWVFLDHDSDVMERHIGIFQDYLLCVLFAEGSGKETLLQDGFGLLQEIDNCRKWLN